MDVELWGVRWVAGVGNGAGVGGHGSGAVARVALCAARPEDWAFSSHRRNVARIGFLTGGRAGSPTAAIGPVDRLRRERAEPRERRLDGVSAGVYPGVAFAAARCV
ncbi:MAG: hypothetical protein AAF742_02230 [Pseudomonadota bacterium]